MCVCVCACEQQHEFSAIPLPMVCERGNPLTQKKSAVSRNNILSGGLLVGWLPFLLLLLSSISVTHAAAIGASWYSRSRDVIQQHNTQLTYTILSTRPPVQPSLTRRGGVGYMCVKSRDDTIRSRAAGKQAGSQSVSESCRRARICKEPLWELPTYT